MPRVEAILFDFFGTLVRYDPSRTAQGYSSTHALLSQASIDLSYDAFLRAWVDASDELDAWSRLHEREFSMDDVAQRFLARVAPERDAAELRGALWRSYVTEWEKGIAYITGVRELIDALATRFRIPPSGSDRAAQSLAAGGPRRSGNQAQQTTPGFEALRLAV